MAYIWRVILTSNCSCTYRSTNVSATTHAAEGLESVVRKLTLIAENCSGKAKRGGD